MLLVIGGALVWLITTELAVISTGLFAIWQGHTSTSATILAARGELLTLGSDGIAMTIGLELAILLVGLWMFRRGITLLSQRSEIGTPAQPRPSQPGDTV